MDPEVAWTAESVERLISALEALVGHAKFQTQCLAKLANPPMVLPPAGPRIVAVSPHKNKQ